MGKGKLRLMSGIIITSAESQGRKGGVDLKYSAYKSVDLPLPCK